MNHIKMGLSASAMHNHLLKLNLERTKTFLGREKEQTNKELQPHWPLEIFTCKIHPSAVALLSAQGVVLVSVCILQCCWGSWGSQNFAAGDKESKPAECIFLRAFHTIRTAVMMGVAEQYALFGIFWSSLESCQRYLSSLWWFWSSLSPESSQGWVWFLVWGLSHTKLPLNCKPQSSAGCSHSQHGCFCSGGLNGMAFGEMEGRRVLNISLRHQSLGAYCCQSMWVCCRTLDWGF